MDIVVFLISLILILVVGIATGIMIGSYGPVRISGKLIIATDEEDGSNYIFLEMNKLTIQELKNRQVVYLTVSDRTRK